LHAALASTNVPPAQFPKAIVTLLILTLVLTAVLVQTFAHQAQSLQASNPLFSTKQQTQRLKSNMDLEPFFFYRATTKAYRSSSHVPF
jgi:hypothetical protein